MQRSNRFTPARRNSLKEDPETDVEDFLSDSGDSEDSEEDSLEEIEI